MIQFFSRINNRFQMALRSGQEDKFKNIVLKIQPARPHSPDLHSSNPIKPTSSPTNANSPNRPSTPINAYKFLKEVPIATSQIQARPYFQSNSQGTMNEPELRNRNTSETLRNHASAIISTNFQQENEQALIYRLQSEIREKEEIISELKSIIRLSSENTNKSKLKSSFISGDRSPELKIQELQKQMKELRYNVKVLTIENNSLSDYIDRLKQTLGSKQIENFDIDRQDKEGKNNIHRLQSIEAHYKAQLNKLKKIISQQQIEYQNKIDELIASHKSLAHECKIIQQQKGRLLEQNNRFNVQLRDFDENYKKLYFSLEEKMKNNTLQKFSIQKIKDQYAESLKQVKNTVTFETQHLFDQFRSKIELVSKKIQIMDQQIEKIEELIRFSREKEVRLSPKARKSDIYIEESMGSSQNSSNSKRLQTSREQRVITSRVYEEGADSRRISDEATRPLKEEVVRLKGIVNQLENQISQRSDYYTFRERQYEDSTAQLSSERLKVNYRDEQLLKLKKEKSLRQKELFDQIQRHKLELNKADMSFKREKTTITESFIAQIQKKDLLISQLKSEMGMLKLRYQQAASQIGRLTSSNRLEIELQRDNMKLKEELQECIRKIEQYKKLFTILKEESDENNYYQELLQDMKSQIYLVREKYHNDLSRLSQLQKENEDLGTINKEIKIKLEENLQKVNQISFDEQRYKENVRSLENQRAELNNQVTYLKSTIKNLEDDLKVKIDNEIELIEQKKKMEQQIVGYLSLVRKMSIEEPKELKNSRCIHEQFGLQQLLSKVNKLESTMIDQKTSKREKREKMVKVLSETLTEAQFFENRRL